MLQHYAEGNDNYTSDQQLTALLNSPYKHHTCYKAIISTGTHHKTL